MDLFFPTYPETFWLRCKPQKLVLVDFFYISFLPPLKDIRNPQNKCGLKYNNT